MEEQVQEATQNNQTVNCECTCIHKLGYVEVTNGEGTRCQMTVEQAQNELAKLESMQASLKGVQHAA